jgi:hypothetical protein
MSKQQDSFNRAQRAYDKMEPPAGDEYDECPFCEGTGYTSYSNCCNAVVINSDICSKCKEHCDYDECDRCFGKGELNMTAYLAAEKRQAYENWLENKADEAREERMIELGNQQKIGSNLDKFLGKGIKE